MRDSILALLWAGSLIAAHRIGFRRGKKEMVKFLYAVLLVALVCSPVMAGHVCVQKQVVHQQYAYAAPIVLQQVQPYYYYAVGSAVQEEAIAERISRLVTAKVAQKLKFSEATPADAPPGEAILKNKCAACHQAGTKAVVDRGAPVLFDNRGIWSGNPQQAAKAITAVKFGIMPEAPAPPLDDDEHLAVKVYLERVSGIIRPAEEPADEPPAPPPIQAPSALKSPPKNAIPLKSDRETWKLRPGQVGVVNIEDIDPANRPPAIPVNSLSK